MAAHRIRARRRESQDSLTKGLRMRCVHRPQGRTVCGARRGFLLVGSREVLVLLTMIAVMVLGFDRVQRALEFRRARERPLSAPVQSLKYDESNNAVWALRRSSGLSRCELPNLEPTEFHPFAQDFGSFAMAAPSGHTVFVSSQVNGDIEIHVDGRCVAVQPTESQTRVGATAPPSVDVSHDGQIIIGAAPNGLVHRWERDGRQLAHSEMRCGEAIDRAKVSRNGRLLATLSDRTRFRIWDLEQGVEVSGWDVDHNFCSSFAWSPDESRIATTGSDRSLCVWNVRTGELDWSRTADLMDPLGAAFSPCGQWLASGGFDNCVRVWNASTGELADEHAGHARPARVFAWSGDSRRLFSSGLDGQVQVWPAPQ